MNHKLLTLGFILAGTTLAVPAILKWPNNKNEDIEDLCIESKEGWDECTRKMIPASKRAIEELEKQRSKVSRDNKVQITRGEYDAQVWGACGKRVASGVNEKGKTEAERFSCESEISSKYYITS